MFYCPEQLASSFPRKGVGRSKGKCGQFPQVLISPLPPSPSDSIRPTSQIPCVRLCIVCNCTQCNAWHYQDICILEEKATCDASWIRFDITKRTVECRAPYISNSGANGGFHSDILLALHLFENIFLGEKFDIIIKDSSGIEKENQVYFLSFVSPGLLKAFWISIRYISRGA